jgi:hypothetical protein
MHTTGSSSFPKAMDIPGLFRTWLDLIQRPITTLVESIVKRVIVWLATRKDAIWVPDPADVIGALPRFQTRRAELIERWGDEVPWADLILEARRFVPT